MGSLAATVIGAAGTGVSALGSIASANQQRAIAEAQSKTLEREAAYQNKVTSQQKRQVQRQRDRVIGAQRAAYGAAGVDPSYGTPQSLLTESFREADIDAAAIRFAGDTRRQNLLFQSDMQDMLGRQNQIAGYFDAGSSLLSGTRSLLSGSAESDLLRRLRD